MIDRKNITIDRSLAAELKTFAEKKHGFTHGAVKAEAEEAIKKHIHGV
jgi:SpoVK/Ycf46/Vps4 family AAA+-type ATPase